MAVIVPTVTEVSLAEPREGAQTMAVGVIRVEGKGTVEVGFRVGPAAQRLTHGAKVLQVKTAFGISRDGGRETSFCVFVKAEGCERIAEVVQQFRMIGRRRQSTNVEFSSLFAASTAGQEIAQIGHRGQEVGRLFEGGSVGGFGLVKAVQVDECITSIVMDAGLIKGQLKGPVEGCDGFFRPA